jgi:hypothetical protein
MNEFAERLSIVEKIQNQMYDGIHGVKHDIQGVK